MSLQKMRVICDALELHDPRIPEKQKVVTSPKLQDLRRILQEQVVGAGRKAVIFSSFELLDRFRDDPECRRWSRAFRSA